MDKYGITVREVFEGVWMKKKFSHEFTSRSRFVWIDAEAQTFYWSKKEGRNPAQAKGINLVTEVIPGGVILDKTQFRLKARPGWKTVRLTVVGSINNEATAAAWVTVAALINREPEKR